MYRHILYVNLVRISKKGTLPLHVLEEINSGDSL